MQQTLAIIKPDAVRNKHMGNILSIIEQHDFYIKKIKYTKLSEKKAEEFYNVHKGKPFFEGLIKYMTSGPIMVLLLEREDAIKTWRNLMGATNPEKAEEGTIRKQFGTGLTENATHGSDAPETASYEIKCMFGEE